MYKQVILFDLDGTLVDSYPGIIESVRYALISMGAEVPGPEDLNRFVGPPLRESFMRYCRFDEEAAELAVTRYREKFSTDGVYNFTPYPGIEQLIAGLKAAGKTVLIATSKPHVYARKILERMGVLQHIDFLSGCELDGARSKKVEVIEYALEQFGIADRSSAVMVGDREHDIIGAKQAGLDCIGVLYGYGNREELLAAGADASLIVGSVLELANKLLP